MLVAPEEQNHSSQSDFETFNSSSFTLDNERKLAASCSAKVLRQSRMFSEYKSKGLFFKALFQMHVMQWPEPWNAVPSNPRGQSVTGRGAVREEVDFKKDVENEDRNRKGLRSVSYPIQLNWKYREQKVE